MTVTLLQLIAAYAGAIDEVMKEKGQSIALKEYRRREEALTN